VAIDDPSDVVVAGFVSHKAGVVRPAGFHDHKDLALVVDRAGYANVTEAGLLSQEFAVLVQLSEEASGLGGLF
jgi:hypothetical protein